jgi:hypothetical protein
MIILALLNLACFSTGAQTTPSDVLFFDDFSNTDKDWDKVTDTSYSTDYYNNAYRIIVNDPDFDVWANPGKESFTDVNVEVDATKNAGPDDNVFGVICRYIDLDQFYYGLISSDGYYGIMKMTSNGGMLIGEDYLLESDSITLGAATNHIRFDCVGSTLTLYVNGTHLDQQTDSDYTTGNIGLIAGTSADSGGTDILFDNLIIYKP